MESRDDEVNEKEMETDGGKVILSECNSHLDAPATLAGTIGTSDQVIFWSGSPSERPDYSWTFVGDDLSEDAADKPFDPTIEVSKLGTGNVANIMKQPAKDGLVLDFAHSGDLPGEASIYVNVDAAFEDGTTLKLDGSDPEAVAFGEAEAETTVEAGYASFKLTHCSTWALSTDDLSSYQLQETNTPGAVKQSTTGADAETIGSDAGVGSWLVPAAAAVVALAVVGAVVVLVVRRKKRAEGEAAAEDEPAAAENAPAEDEPAAAEDAPAGEPAAAEDAPAEDAPAPETPAAEVGEGDADQAE